MNEIIEVQSPFQKIRVVHDPVYYGEHTLYLDGAWQYSSLFEYRYHETMVTLPACMVENLNKVLICGGGDGLAAREILRFGRNIQIDLVEIDPEMIRLFSDERLLTNLNRGSLRDSSVRIRTMDAVKFVEETQDTYDLIFLDFPSPNESNARKNYINLFSPKVLDRFVDRLNDWGILCSQTSIQADKLSPFIRRLLERGLYAWNYDAVYNREGQHDNFTTASRRIPKKNREIPNACRLVTDDHLRVGFSNATEVTEYDVEYYRLFEFVEGIEVEQSQ